MNNVDVTVVNQGSVFAFYLNTQEAKDWVEENVQTEGYQWLGDGMFAVEWRYAAALARGMQEDGLVVA